jgi:hypothetical protein
MMQSFYSVRFSPVPASLEQGVIIPFSQEFWCERAKIKHPLTLESTAFLAPYPPPLDATLYREHLQKKLSLTFAGVWHKMRGFTETSRGRFCENLFS